MRPRMADDTLILRGPGEVHIGLASLAAILEKNGIDTEVIDNELLKKKNYDLAVMIRQLQPDLVGITCDLVTISVVSELTNILKSFLLPVVIGGPQANIYPKEVLLKTGADFCVYGEGEETLLELCVYLRSGDSRQEALFAIKGIVFRDTQGNLIQTEERSLISELDTLPFLALDKFILGKYPRKNRFLSVWPVDCLITSRGCPYRCTFCSFQTAWGSRYRAMSPKRMVDEIEDMIQRYGTRAISFRDDHFTFDKKRVYLFCNELINRKISIRWVCESRVDALDGPLLEIMKASGCESIWFGVESGVQRVLDMLRKDITIEQIENCFALCNKHGVFTGASIMLGIPGETRKEVFETIRFTKKLNPSIVFVNIFRGIPGTKIYDDIISQGLAYKRYEGLILPHTHDMSWQEKQWIVFFAKLIFAFRPNELRRSIAERGIVNYLREKTVNIMRLLKK